MSSTACSLLWTHVALDMDGSVMPCCRFVVDPTDRVDPRKEKSTWIKTGVPYMHQGLHSAFTGKEFSHMRETMLAGGKLSGCKKCWDTEASGVESARQNWNKKYSHFIGTQPKLRFLEIGFSTHCNLACRMCSPEYSSKWHSIVHPGKTVDVGFTDYIKKLNTADLSEVEYVKFVGGEPMMDKNHDKFILSLEDFGIDLSQLTLRYHTNGTIRASQSILQTWKKVKKVVLNISVDGVGEVNEYQRPGHKWQQLDDTVDFYLQLAQNELPNLDVETHCVITRFNLFHLHELTHWHSTKKFTDISFDATNYPVYISIRQLNEQDKQRAEKYLTDLFSQNPHYQGSWEQILNKLKQPIIQEHYAGTTEMLEVFKPLDEYFNQTTEEKL